MADVRTDAQESQAAEREQRRLFILGVKDISEEELREHFGQFGEITEFKKTYDKSGEDRGVAYLSFKKASEAFYAVEECDGRAPPSKPTRTLRVNISRNNKEPPKESETVLNKVFIRVDPKLTEAELKAEFEQYGPVSSVRVVRNKETRESRGLCFVTYDKKSSAALAIEQCSPDYQAKFAENKFAQGGPHMGAYGQRAQMGGRAFGGPDMGRPGYGPPPPRKGNYGQGYDVLQPPPIPRSPYEDFEALSGGKGYRDGGVRHMIESQSASKNTSCVVQVKGCMNISERQLFKLFDIVPGLKMCKLDDTTGKAVIKYESPECAAHAAEKLHNLEYPPGVIECQLQAVVNSGVASAAEQLQESVKNLMSGNADIHALVGTIQKATEALQNAGLQSESGLERVSWCSCPLPPTQPLNRGTMAEKLFIHIMVLDNMHMPRGQFPPSFQNMMQDAFCRFGNLINLSVLKGKSCAFAQYADRDSAQQALSTLDGEILGNYAKLRVMFAENFKDRDTKREGSAMDASYEAKRSRSDASDDTF